MEFRLAERKKVFMLLFLTRRSLSELGNELLIHIIMGYNYREKNDGTSGLKIERARSWKNVCKYFETL